MFITISPKVIDNELCVVLAAAQEGSVAQCDLNINVTQRAKLLSTNTVAVTRAYEWMAQAFMSILLGAPTSTSIKSSRKSCRGLFGQITAAFGVHEVQGRCYLHAHHMVIGQFDPVLAQQHCHKPDVKEMFCNIIDSITCGSLDGYDDIRQEAKVKREQRESLWKKRRDELYG